MRAEIFSSRKTISLYLFHINQFKKSETWGFYGEEEKLQHEIFEPYEDVCNF
jgi:hypothetical protein